MAGEDILGTGPGGLQVVSDWIGDLYSDHPSARLWAVLDDPLRLALAQGWILGVIGRPDQSFAERLAAPDSTDTHFAEMFAYLVEHWRSVYVAVRHGFGVWSEPVLVGANMELVILTAPEHIGYYEANTQIPVHSFIVRCVTADQWVIAATARRLPVPGWPPTEELIQGLEIGN